MSLEYSTSTTIAKMNYSDAIKASTFTSAPKFPCDKIDISMLEKGWVLLKHGEMVDTLTVEERIHMEEAEFQTRVNEQMNEISNRHLNRQRDELELEGFNNEEIESIIEKNLMSEYDCEEDDSSDEDDEYYMYSDEEGYY